MPLPIELLYRRLEREIGLLAASSDFSVAPLTLQPGRMSFPVKLEVRLNGILGLKRFNGEVVETRDNRFSVVLRRDYPFMKPVVRWRSDIFHPNISCPAEGGVVCMRLLQEWRADRTLLSLAEGLAALVEHPNLNEPLNFESCMKACEHLKGAEVQK